MSDIPQLGPVTVPQSFQSVYDREIELKRYLETFELEGIFDVLNSFGVDSLRRLRKMTKEIKQCVRDQLPLMYQKDFDKLTFSKKPKPIRKNMPTILIRPDLLPSMYTSLISRSRDWGALDIVSLDGGETLHSDIKFVIKENKLKMVCYCQKMFSIPSIKNRNYLDWRSVKTHFASDAHIKARDAPINLSKLIDSLETKLPTK